MSPSSANRCREASSPNHVNALVTGLRDIVGTLADADPDGKAELYRELGVTLAYRPGGWANVQVLRLRVNVRVGGVCVSEGA